MLRLLLFRHAKSSWDERDLADHERPLSPRGVNAAPKMGRFMVDSGYVPDLIVCSTAVRTRQTLALAFEESDIEGTKIEFDRAIYEVGPNRILARIRQVNDEVATLMIIGHNPGMQTVALGLTGSGDTAVRQQLARKFPTAGLAVIDFEAKVWRDIEARSGHLVVFTAPKLLA